MYKIKRREITKLAGTSISSDQKQWPTEVLKALVEQHPYVDTSQIRIQFTRIEPESKSSAGKIIVANKAALPFSIRKDETTKRLEIDPLDIVFDGTKFSHLNENSLRRILDSQQVGRLTKPSDSVPGGNRYIGDLTGDVTPLEWSSYPGGFAGPRSVTASSGLLSYVIKNQEDVNKLFNTLATYDGVNSVVETSGLRDSLEALEDGMVEAIDGRRMAHVIKRPSGGFAISFDGGDTRTITAKDLRVALGPNFEPVMRQVVQRGWGIVRDFPTMRSVDATVLDITPEPITLGGMYRLTEIDGRRVTALVCSQMVDFDGSEIKRQKAIDCDTGRSYEGVAIQGWRISDCSPPASNRFSGRRSITRDYPSITQDAAMFPIGIIDAGNAGCFVDESWGAPKATPDFTIEQVISMPNEPDVLIVKRDDGGRSGLVIVEALVRPTKIPPGHYGEGVLPEHSYYIPGHMSFVQTSGKMALADKAAVQEARPMALLQKTAGQYHLQGQIADGETVNLQNMKEASVRNTLAWLGADDDVIEDVMAMNNFDEKKLWGLAPPEDLEKEASVYAVVGAEAYIERLKVAAEQAIEGANQTPESLQDPRTMDAILSLQFVNDETLLSLLESEDLFAECEDRLARLLLASRQGEESIQESGVKKALSGIGSAINSLKALGVELRSRGA